MRSDPGLPPRGRLYLDVDGVLSPYLAPGEVPRSWPDFREGLLGRRLAVWSESMLTSIGQLPIEVVWVTTWGDEAERSFGPVLGSQRPRRVLDLSSAGLGTAGPKPAAIAEDLGAGPSAFVWVDDEAITPPAIYQLRTFGQPMLTISPDRRTGLKPDHLEDIAAFLDTLLPSTPAG